MTPAGVLPRAAVGIGLLAVLLLAPVVLADRAVDLCLAPIYAVIGLSLNVLIGRAGTISLGHQAFVGVGAFATAFVVGQHGEPFLLGVAVAALLGAAQAVVLGGLALRISGLYLALVTLAYGVMAQDSLFGIESLTGGGAGARAPRPVGYTAYYYVCLGFLGVVLYLDRRLGRSAAGRALEALRENPRVAATFGIDTVTTTLVGFAVAGLFAGIGGALLAHRDEVVSPVGFGFPLALTFVMMTVVGGLRSRTGIVLGSSLFALLEVLVQDVPGVERALVRWDVTAPVAAVLAGAVLAWRWRERSRLIGLGLVALGLAVLSPLHVPVVEGRLAAVPPLSPERASGVLGPLLLLVVLTRLPGGIGQLVKPIERWLRGEELRWDLRPEREVVVTDVRA